MIQGLKYEPAPLPQHICVKWLLLLTRLLTPFTLSPIGASMNRVRQPRTLVVLGLNAGMGTAAGADELVAESQPA